MVARRKSMARLKHKARKAVGGKKPTKSPRLAVWICASSQKGALFLHTQGPRVYGTIQHPPRASVIGRANLVFFEISKRA